MELWFKVYFIFVKDIKPKNRIFKIFYHIRPKTQTRAEERNHSPVNLKSINNRTETINSLNEYVNMIYDKSDILWRKSTCLRNKSIEKSNVL